MGRLQRYLDVLTSVVTISTGIALIWVLAFASPRKTARPPDIKPGAVVQLPAGLASTHGANQTALVFIRSGCHFCSESMPLYRSLVADLSGMVTPRTKIVFVSQEPVTTTVEYLKSNGITLASDQVATIGPNQFPFVRGTPTILLIDQNATLLQAWHGRLDDASALRLKKSLM